MFSGDPACEHEDEELRGRGPGMQLIACGSEEYCWAVVREFTFRKPLREWESVEVLVRDPDLAGVLPTRRV